MKRFLNSLSPWTEFFIVTGIAFGPFLLAEVLSLAVPRSGPHHTSLSLLVLAVHELVIGGLLLWFLRARGWALRDLGLTENSPLEDLGAGGLLFLAAYFAWIIIWNLILLASPDLIASIKDVSRNVVGGHIPPLTSVMVSVVNGAFEELFVTGYVMSALARQQKSTWFCVNVSTALRLAYHLYQGPLAVLWVVPTGLIFTFWFARTKRLWPIIGAHILMDTVALLAHA
jgi:membrane protease YdiL (CAAX protease family)